MCGRTLPSCKGKSITQSPLRHTYIGCNLPNMTRLDLTCDLPDGKPRDDRTADGKVVGLLLPSPLAFLLSCVMGSRMSTCAVAQQVSNIVDEQRETSTDTYPNPTTSNPPPPVAGRGSRGAVGSYSAAVCRRVAGRVRAPAQGLKATCCMSVPGMT